MNSQSSDILDSADDRILADRAADGDTEAFAVLVRRYTPTMRAYARRLMAGSADVDDVVQEALVTAWEKLPQLEDTEKTKSWLMRITSHKAIDRMRATHQHADISDVTLAAPKSTAPAARTEIRSGALALRDALSGLPDEQRKCWVLKEIGGQTYEQMASELGVSTSTVRGLLARARKNIMVQMGNWR